MGLCLLLPSPPPGVLDNEGGGVPALTHGLSFPLLQCEATS